jgi:hypothetical protein
LATHRDREFADRAAWERHLERLGITALRVTWKTAWKSDPVSGVNSVQSGPTLRIG